MNEEIAPSPDSVKSKPHEAEVRMRFTGRDEIELKELWEVFWRGRALIALTSLVCLTASIFLARSMPDVYKAEGIYAPAKARGDLDSLAAQYGGLAAIAGIDMNKGGTNDIDQAIALAGSWWFLEGFVKKYNLKPNIVAIKSWDAKARLPIFDEEIYDAQKQEWKVDQKTGLTLEPSSYETYKKLKSMVQIIPNPKSGMLSVAVEHVVPEMSSKWVELLVSNVNKYFQDRDMLDSRRNIEYLEKKIKETSISQMQSVFYGMIEVHTKTLMLAEVSDEYLLREIVRPLVPEQKHSPNRLLIVMLGAILGVGLGICFVFGKFLWSKVR